MELPAVMRGLVGVGEQPFEQLALRERRCRNYGKDALFVGFHIGGVYHQCPNLTIFVSDFDGRIHKVDV